MMTTGFQTCNEEWMMTSLTKRTGWGSSTLSFVSIEFVGALSTSNEGVE